MSQRRRKDISKGNFMSKNYYTTFSVSIIVISISIFVLVRDAGYSIRHANIADGSIVVKPESFSVNFHTERGMATAQVPVGIRALE
jgi:hypothetical protein